MNKTYEIKNNAKSQEKNILSPRYFMPNEDGAVTNDANILYRTSSEKYLNKTCEACKERGEIIKNYVKNLENFEEQIASKDRQILLLETKLTEKTELNKQSNQRLCETETELSKLKTNKQKLLINHDCQLEDINKENMSLRNEMWQLKSDHSIQINNLKTELLTYQSDLQAKENEHRIVSTSLKNNIHALEKELNMMQLTYMDVSSQLEKHQAMNDMYKQQIDNLKKMNDDLTQILANKIEHEKQYNEIPVVENDQIFEFMQTDLNNGSKFTNKLLKLIKKQKKSGKSTRLTGNYNPIAKRSTPL